MNIEDMTVKQLLELFRAYNTRHNAEFSMLCLYDDGSGRILHLDDVWNATRAAFYNHTPKKQFGLEELTSILTGE